MNGEKYDAILQKIADSQLLTAESIKAINHNTTVQAACSEAMKEAIVQHAQRTIDEHKTIFDKISEYKTLIYILIALVAALVGIKLAFPNL